MVAFAKQPESEPTGSNGIEWTTQQIHHFDQQGAAVYLVNQGFEQSPAEAMIGDEFDFEARAWTLPTLLKVVEARRAVKWSTRIYCTWSNYGAIKQALAEAGIGRSVFFRIADWNLDQHTADLELHADVYAGQWADPISHPMTLVPGTNMTLAAAGADLSVVLHEFTGWQG